MDQSLINGIYNQKSKILTVSIIVLLVTLVDVLFLNLLFNQNQKTDILIIIMALWNCIISIIYLISEFKRKIIQNNMD